MSPALVLSSSGGLFRCPCPRKFRTSRRLTPSGLLTTGESDLFTGRQERACHNQGAVSSQETVWRATARIGLAHSVGISHRNHRPGKAVSMKWRCQPGA